MNGNDHLIPLESGRGFLGLPEIHGTYPGKVRVYESSGAARPQLWLCVEAAESLDRPDGPWKEATVHLALEDAVRLAEQIMFLAEHHYQICDPNKRQAAKALGREAAAAAWPEEAPNV